MPHFQIVTADGESFGSTELDRSDWSPGEEIQVGGRPAFRIIEVIEPDDPETFTILLVNLM